MLYASSAPPRYFTPQEANAVVPSIRAYLFKIREHGRVLREIERALDDASGEEERARLRLERSQRAAAQAHLLERIGALGGELIDPLELGQVRFRAMRNGEPVWLVWHLEDRRVERWTPIASRIFGQRPPQNEPRVGWEWRN